VKDWGLWVRLVVLTRGGAYIVRLAAVQRAHRDRLGWRVATARISTRDDRVLRSTRALSMFIAPFLLVGFALLYVVPDDTGRLFAWTIRPTMTSMALGSAYLGGAYFFVRILREPRWNAARTGFLSVTAFATLLGVATIIHWDRFNHGHVAFWAWAALYFTTPFLVFGAWLVNQRVASPPSAQERRLGGVTQAVVGAVGLLALTQGLVMFLSPAIMIPLWPWTLTPLTCRVMGAIFCLGSAGIAVLRDSRWTSLKLMLQVEALMLVLILVAAVRARSQFDTTRPLTWILLTGLLAVLLGSGYLWYALEIRPDDGRRARTGLRHGG